MTARKRAAEIFGHAPAEVTHFPHFHDQVLWDFMQFGDPVLIGNRNIPNPFPNVVQEFLNRFRISDHFVNLTLS